jgi:hypothetical protein
LPLFCSFFLIDVPQPTIRVKWLCVLAEDRFVLVNDPQIHTYRHPKGKEPTIWGCKSDSREHTFQQQVNAWMDPVGFPDHYIQYRVHPKLRSSVPI